jgi:nucleotide-binding universal stress UspA family protein
MNGKMKILIAYDGSECADAALDDLRRAGLPDVAEALLLSVADVFLPPPDDETADDTLPVPVPAVVRRAHELAAKALESAHELAECAAERVRKMFPEWDVHSDACADSPAWAVVRTTDEWKPDLVVVGAHGHNVLGGRLILGSVSQRVLYEARSSVRVARTPKNDSGSPVRIIVGTDGSSNAEVAIDAVAARTWPAGSEVRLVCVLDTTMVIRVDAESPSVMKWVDAEDEKDWDWVRLVFEPSAEKLRNAKLVTSVELRKGNPKSVLVEEAEEWEADSIFLGAKGVRGVEHFLLGSVSAAVAARAPCSVEIMRRPAAGGGERE